MEQVDQTVMEDEEGKIKTEAEDIGDTQAAVEDGRAADESSCRQQKGVRRRKKRLLGQIVQQMEFYFSAANVTKDRFMSGLLNKDPYISLDTFFRFNRIRSLTTDVEMLRTAITKSSILALSEDGEKVCRTTKIEGKVDETECTIYVEHIPTHADHEWVRQVFSQYGTIDYISLPRFRRSGRPKGFVFVEFGNPEMANTALEAFGALDCRISTTSDPKTLQSIKTFTEEEVDMVEGGGKEGLDEKSMELDITSGNKVKGMVKEDIGKVGKKRKLSDDDDDDDNDSKNGVLPKAAKDLSSAVKLNDKVDAAESGTMSKVKNELKKEQVESESSYAGDKSLRPVSKREIDSEDNTCSGKNTDVKTEKKRILDEDEKQESDTKKKRKESKSKEEKDISDPNAEMPVKQIENDGGDREVIGPENVDNPAGGKKKKKKRKRNKKEKEEEVDSIYLRVMSKADWKKLRNKYLNAQRENMRALKRELQERYHSCRTEASDWNTCPSFLAPAGDTPGNPEKQTSNESDLSKSQSLGVQFNPSTIIKISFEEPPPDPKKLREAIRDGSSTGSTDGEVAYVDVNSTERDVFVRFHTKEAAAAYKKTGCWSRMEILAGAEEEVYWGRINACWAERRSKKKNKATQDFARGGDLGRGEVRGREKLLGKAVREAQNTRPNSHIIFED